MKYNYFFETEENFLVMNADILTNLDIDKLIAADKVLSEGDHNYIATLAVTNRASSRNLLFTAEGNLIGWRNNSSREEKWSASMTNDSTESPTYIAKAFSGIQILHSSFFTNLSMNGKFSLIVDENDCNPLIKIRQYNGPVNLTKMEIKILDKYGNIVDLNFMDYSFSLELEILYERNNIV